jgi:uncharacterized GH25 family protein
MRSLLALLLLSPAAFAHDFWLAPRGNPSPGDTVDLPLIVGHHFEDESERAFAKKGVLAFTAHGPKARVDLLAAGKEDAKPFARVACPDAGTYRASLRRAPVLIELAAKKFEGYLEDEGLTHVVAERKKRGESDKPGRERYARSIKAYWSAGKSGGDAWKQADGHPLELVPLADPTAWGRKDKARFRLLLDGKALPGARVTCFWRGPEKIKKAPAHATTDKAGEVAFALGHTGEYLVRLVHMGRAEKDAEADWVSHWAALYFRVW